MVMRFKDCFGVGEINCYFRTMFHVKYFSNHMTIKIAEEKKYYVCEFEDKDVVISDYLTEGVKLCFPCILEEEWVSPMVDILYTRSRYYYYYPLLPNMKIYNKGESCI